MRLEKPDVGLDLERRCDFSVVLLEAGTKASGGRPPATLWATAMAKGLVFFRGEGRYVGLLRGAKDAGSVSAHVKSPRPANAHVLPAEPESPGVAVAYDLAKPRRVALPVREVCNQVVHRNVFTLWFGKDGLFRGIFFSSDFEKNRGVYRLEIGAVINLFERIANSTAPAMLRGQPERNRLEM